MNEQLYEIYKNSKEYSLWPLKKEKFVDIFSGLKDVDTETKIFTEEVDEKAVGFLCAKYKEDRNRKKGAIHFIFVIENFRHQKIGDRLLKNGIEWLKEKGAEEITFGENVGTYFWPGIPENLNLTKLFQNNGFEVSNGPVDMFQEISNFSAPKGVYDSLKEYGVKIEYASEKNINEISRFVEKNFPNWAQYYPKKYVQKENAWIFYSHKGDEIIGVSHLWKGNSNWDLLFENNVGGGGALGVSKKWRGKGIGLAMKCWGTEVLKTDNVKYVWIGWTYEIDFYKKLGFEIWRRYLSAKLSMRN